MRILSVLIFFLFLLAGQAIAQVGDFYVKKGNEFYKEGKWDKAIEQFQLAIGINPGHMGARQNLGLAYQSKRDLTHAIEVFQAIKKDDPLFVPAYISLGLVYVQKGRYKDAEREYADAVGLEPDNLVAHLNLATVLAKQGEFGRASRAARRGLKISPSSPHLHLLLANIYYSMEKYPAAALEYQKALKAEPQATVPRVNLAMALAKIGKFDKALVQMEIVRSFEANLPQIPLYLGKIHAMRYRKEQKGWKEAVAEFRKAVLALPEDVEVYKELGDILAENAQYAEARKWYRRVLESPNASVGDRDSIESKMQSWPKEAPRANVSSKL